MNTVNVHSLSKDTVVENPLAFNENMIAFPTGTVISKEDIDMLEFWKIPHLTEHEGFAVNPDDVCNWSKNAEIFKKELLELYNLMSGFYEEIETRGTGSFSKVKQKFPDIYSMIKQEKDLTLLLINTKSLKKESLVMGAIECAIYSIIIGMTLKFDEEKIESLFKIALLIDLGMLRMKKLLMKREELNEQEKAKILSHPVQSYKLVSGKYGLTKIETLSILTHHENYDGSGYPRKLPQNKIPLYAQIVGIAQEFSALCQRRSYRKKNSLYHAMRTLMGEGKKKFNPTILSAFLANMSLYPIGTLLYLSNETLAVVTGANPKSSMRPTVKPIMDSNRQRVKDSTVIDLSQDKKILIKKVVNDEKIEDNILEFFKSEVS